VQYSGIGSGQQDYHRVVSAPTVRGGSSDPRAPRLRRELVAFLRVSSGRTAAARLRSGDECWPCGHAASSLQGLRARKLCDAGRRSCHGDTPGRAERLTLACLAVPISLAPNLALSARSRGPRGWSRVTRPCRPEAHPAGAARLPLCGDHSADSPLLDRVYRAMTIGRDTACPNSSHGNVEPIGSGHVLDPSPGGGIITSWIPAANQTGRERHAPCWRPDPHWRSNVPAGVVLAHRPHSALRLDVC